jgi:hypothetical protein
MIKVRGTRQAGRQAAVTGFAVGLITVHRDEAVERNYKLKGWR